MTRGIVYLNVGEAYLERLAVSILSLREVYAGPIQVISNTAPPPCLIDVDDLVCQYRVIDLDPRLAKTLFWKESDFDTTLYLDSDTIILKDPWDLFAEIEREGLMVTQFSDWDTETERHMTGRIGSWTSAIGPIGVQRALEYGHAINTGVVGWSAGYPHLEAWYAMAKKGWDKNCTRRMIDELALQVMLPDIPHTLIGEEWNRSVQYGLSNDPAIIHYHGDKHDLDVYPLCDVWRKWRDELHERYPSMPMQPEAGA